MSTINHLPNEILAMILSSLPAPDLARVSLVSRCLCFIARPLLYKEPVLSLRQYHPPRLQAFICTLITPGCEALATHVRRLSISWGNERIGFDDPDHALFTTAILHYELGGRALSANIQVILLLYLLPSLHILHVNPLINDTWFGDFMDLLDEIQSDTSLTSLPIGLQSLRELRGGFRTIAKSSSIAAVLRLPNIRTVAIPISGDKDQQWRASDFYAAANYRTSSVTMLEFTYVRISLSCLRGILEVPRALTSCSYTAIPPSYGHFNLSDLAAALHPLRESLQTLVLDFSRLRPRKEVPPPPSAAVSFRDWPALRNVSSSLMPLLGKRIELVPVQQLADALPARTRSLVVLWDGFCSGTEVVNELVMLLERKEARVPGLKSVALSAKIALTSEMVERVRVACETADVLFVGNAL